MQDPAKPRWLLLIHQIPPKPDYFRVKIWRRLQRLGAVPIKNSVYVLPFSEQACEDFQWVLKEIVQGRGEASICEARFIEGLSDEEVEASFREARNADYALLEREARRALDRVRRNPPRKRNGPSDPQGHLARLRRRFAEVAKVDFFSAPARRSTERLLDQFEARLRAGARRANVPGPRRSVTGPMRGRIWVTRRGIHVDRMASGWLIRRFIDPDAQIQFAPSKGYRARAGELRFDMFEAEFGHEGDRCSFEVLLEKFGLEDRALKAIAEIVHDIDLKDSKFGRPEVPGIEVVITGISLTHPADEERLVRGAAVFDELFEYFRQGKERSPRKSAHVRPR